MAYRVMLLWKLEHRPARQWKTTDQGLEHLEVAVMAVPALTIKGMFHHHSRLAKAELGFLFILLYPKPYAGFCLSLIPHKI